MDAEAGSGTGPQSGQGVSTSTFPTHPLVQQLQPLSCRKSSSLKDLRAPTWGPCDGTMRGGSLGAGKRQQGPSGLETRQRLSTWGRARRSSPLRAGSRGQGGPFLIPLLRASHGPLWGQRNVALVLGGTGCTSAGPSGCVHTHLQPQLTPRPRLREPSSPPVPQLPLSSSPPDVSMPGSVHPQSHGLEPFGKAFGSRLRHAPPAALLSGFTASRSGGMCRSCSHGGCRGRTATMVPTKGSRPSGRNPGATRAIATSLHLHPRPGHGECLQVPVGTWP